eukprot:CAMPEP_0184865462 /NCGR_PEP_ID=MMETSP0580-20130426/18204_1 /TAXON_ID=1118495 /ORGANISM="Dactyliosolen fragilissimus" /LENGTH=410 /DNA_ID=CAMNT_0027364681 /DNA_START=358 /DNA_END=1587 /DNA_ORIENTATION=+
MKAEKIRFPQPRNVVLLSLMEAANLMSEDQGRFLPDVENSGESDEVVLPKQLSYDSDTEVEKMKLVTSLASGSCGTYAVTSEEGLPIVLSPPSRSSVDEKIPLTRQSSIRWETDMNDIFDKVKSSLSVSSSSPKKVQNTSTDKEKENYIPSNMILRRGDRIQVVTIKNGWAKLARGYGYVACKDQSDLVKVGGPIDRACSIEAILRSLLDQRNQLKIDQMKAEKDAVGLMSELQKFMIQEEDLTVIGADAFDNTLGASNSELKKVDPPSTPEKPQQKIEVIKSEHSSGKKMLQELPSSKIMPKAPTTSTGFLSFASGIMGMVQSKSVEIEVTNVATPDKNQRSLSKIISVCHDSPAPSKAMIAGAEDWRRRNGRQAAQGVDFKTGMSGHHAMQSNHHHQHIFVQRQGIKR